MQIGFVEPHLEQYGGIRRVVELASHLIDRGHDVTLYHPEGTPCQWLECRARVLPTAAIFDRSHDVLIYNDPNPRDRRVVRQADAKLKVFYVLALYEKHLLRRFHPKRLLRPRSRMAVTKRALDGADLALVNSTWMYRWLRDVPGLESRLVVGGINPDHFHPVVPAPSADRPFRILHSGDPRPRKGAGTVREALEMVKHREPDVVMDTYHGKGVDQSDMADLYGRADLFVDAQRYAGWNNPVIEAMACGTPVVCTDIGGVQDFAFHGQTALLVPVDDADALARGILRMKRDPALRTRLRDNALEHIKHFTWERSAERLEEVLRERLSGTDLETRPLRHRIWERFQQIRSRLLGRGMHFDKYDLRGPYHWIAYESDPVYRRHVDHIVKTVRGGGTLLDVGCGDGLITAHLADAGFDVTGIDVEPTAIRLARQQRPELPFEHRDIYEMDGVSDVVVSSEVIEHLPDPDRFLEAIRPLFRDRALVTTPERDYYSDIDPYHETEYALHEFAALMNAHFENVDVHTAGKHLYALIHADAASGAGPP